MLMSQRHFDGPPEANGPNMGLPEAHGLRGHCPPFPPLRGPGRMCVCPGLAVSTKSI